MRSSPSAWFSAAACAGRRALEDHVSWGRGRGLRLWADTTTSSIRIVVVVVVVVVVEVEVVVGEEGLGEEGETILAAARDGRSGVL